jgi:NACHT domain- and WD repeat-containing protein
LFFLQVLNDVYQYHVPPVRRIPPLLWTRLRNDLPHYLSEREADGVTVISWYHRQFVEAARERYFRNINFVEETHSILADYFSGRWGGPTVLKPFQYSELQRQRFGLESVHGAANRKVPEQPLHFTDVLTGQVSRYNLRKLSELPYHLLRAHRYQQLFADVSMKCTI